MHGEEDRHRDTEWVGFGPFVLHLKQRVLTQNGKPLPLNTRAVELLAALLERPGSICTKDELLERIWRDRTVAEVNLRVTVAALRKCLAEGGTNEAYVVSTAGHGYAFSRDVHLEYWPPRPGESARAPAGPPPAVHGQLPLLLKPVIGREGIAAKIVGLLSRSRLVSIVGAAGIGKTTIAIVVSSDVSGIAEQVCFVDFAPIRDSNLVLTRIASGLTLDQTGGDPLRTILEKTAGKKVLIVLDNCEHILGSIAEAATAILQNVPGARILATTREPLYVEGEVVHRLEGLPYPEVSFVGSAEEALRYAAVELLVERIRSSDPDFILTDELAAPAAEICRRLDGIALAVQLAAGRVGTFGLAEVASRLDDRFAFLSRGSRTALPRHQTLEGAISWSFELLDANERIVCARLSTFSGEFDLDSAIDVAGWAPLSPREVSIIIAGLVEKSLIVFVSDPTRPHYVFLETIRAFARERLPLIDPDNVLVRKLGQRLIADCDRFGNLIRSGHVVEATAFARRRMDDLRYAIGKAFEMGDTAFHSSLLVKFAPLMLHLGYMFEFTEWSRRALDTVTTAAERLPLLMPYARALGLSRPNVAVEVSLYRDAVEIAESVGDLDSELRARWGLSYLSGAPYSPRESLEAGRAFQDRARMLGDESASFVAQTLQGRALHDLGEFTSSMEVHRRVIDAYRAEASAADANRFGLNHRAVSMCDLSECCWQIGQLNEAEAWNRKAIVEAGDHLPTLFISLSQLLCRTLYVSSDWADIRRQFEVLSGRFNVGARWKSWIRNLEAVIEIHQHRTESALARLDGDLLAGEWQNLTNRNIWIMVPVLQCCLILGKTDLVAKLADKLATEFEAMQCRWFLPEALRLKAVALAQRDDPTAEACFDEARAWAAKLGASSFARYIEASYEQHRNGPVPKVS
jgi:predicted ATPase/DNA-binding winged helix-turn-helix (wHTH) protein